MLESKNIIWMYSLLWSDSRRILVRSRPRKYRRIPINNRNILRSSRILEFITLLNLHEANTTAG
ncbi:hypothetical protein G9C98_002192 [Cotesia typhae]|uniref:Uncharacterized protein n=1 Tax=Cotesia typhae TaxID=2053667 RepID=A0A8J5R9F4_9HYME|nr:hypothetical protein G9C98_002192 [Cotesia typhae]